MPLSLRISIVLTVAGAALFTLLASVTPVLSFAYRNPALHVAMETAAAVISLVAAQLVWGRFRQSFQLRDLLLVAALGVFAGTNLFCSAVPAIVDEEPGSFATWAPALGRLLGAALMALSALVSDQVLRRPMRDARRLLTGCLCGLVGICVLAAVAGDSLGLAIPPDLSPEGDGRPRFVGNAAVVALVATVLLLFGVAAVGYLRLAERTGDELARWLGIAGTLGAFSQLNYVLFPSLYSPYFYTGDVLRLGFLLALFVGGTVELQRTQRELATAAVLEARRRIASDIHAGGAQDLAFILQQGRRLAGQPDSPSVMRHMVIAAGRALDEARDVIAALERTGSEPLSSALSVTAVEVAGREGGVVEMDLDDAVAVPAPTQDMLLRVLREAIINAMRHGGASTIKIQLREDPDVSLIVSDDGQGFDVDAAAASGRLGLRSMAERIRELGGEVIISSVPGSGTRVEVRLP